MRKEARHSRMGKNTGKAAPFTWLTYLNSGFPLGDYLARKAEVAFLAPLAFVLYPLSLCLLRAGIHIWPIFSERLGHQCLESDCAIRWSRYRRAPRSILLVSRRKRCANKEFFDFLPAGTTHLEGRLVFACAVALTYFNHYRRARTFCRVPTARQTYRTIIDNTPLALQMDEHHRRAAHQLLGKLIAESQLPKAEREFRSYCVFNFRHPYKEIAGDRLQAQRYSSAVNLKGALRYLRDAGIAPVLTGAPPREETDCLPVDLFVNYADSQWKSDLSDVLLSGNAAFCLGSTSGLTLLSSVFGVPCIIHNQVPYKDYWYSTQDIVIPKLIREKASGQLIPFGNEVVASALRSHYIVDSDDVPYHYEECSEEDILTATVEMCRRLRIAPGKDVETTRSIHGSISPSFQRKYAAYLPSAV